MVWIQTMAEIRTAAAPPPPFSHNTKAQSWNDPNPWHWRDSTGFVVAQTKRLFLGERLRKRGEGPIVFCLARGQRMKLFYGEAWVFAFFFPFFAREFIFPFFLLLGEMDDYAFGPRRSSKRVGYFFPSKNGNLCQKRVFFSVAARGFFRIHCSHIFARRATGNKNLRQAATLFFLASCNKPCDPQNQWSEGGGAREEEEDKNAYPSPPPRIACNFAKITNKFDSCCF